MTSAHPTAATSSSASAPEITVWCEGLTCCDEAWEQAYRDFETPEEETRKFLGRHRRLGVPDWPRESRIVELFCGRGNGLVALERLGFVHLEGVDLSPRLLKSYRGRARLYVGDCRDLRFPPRSRDALIVQGGLHHLPDIPGDLEQVVSEAARVLTDEGRLLVVEPWRTPFLRAAHAACAVRPLRWCWPKLDALARMTEREYDTYRQWLERPETIRRVLHRHFVPEREQIGWGKLMFVGRKHSGPVEGPQSAPAGSPVRRS